ncbi:MAG: tetratricopeptide repeat protein [Phycisphaerales bacterium]
MANELGGPPVADVQVSTADNASSTSTDEQGRFSLEFPGRVGGEMVQLIVSKSGYVVVNEAQLRWPLPKDADTEPLVLLLCREEAREEMARRFYRLKSFEAIETVYRDRLRALDEDQETTRAQLTQLRRERDEARAAAEKVAEELARIEPGRISELRQEAMRLFLGGKVADAVALLDTEILRKSAEEAKRRKATAEKELADVIEMFLLRARLLTTQFRFDESRAAYEAAISVAPEDFRVLHAYALFNHKLNRRPEALPIYRHCEELARERGDRRGLAMTLTNLGNLQLEQHCLREASQAYGEALAIYRQLATENPDVYLSLVAGVLTNLGILYNKQNQREEARQAYDEALTKQRQLAERRPEIYLPDVALTLNNLGVLCRNANRLDEALQKYEEALAIRRGLAQVNPQMYQPDVAVTLGNLGLLYHKQSRIEEALQAYQEALTIYRGLTKTNPETHRPNLAWILHNLGNLYRDQKRWDEARQACEEALRIRYELTKVDPEVYWSEVGTTVVDLMMVNYHQKHEEDFEGQPLR